MITRPICKCCNKTPCAVNYIRAGVTHYRSMCDNCGRLAKKQKPKKPKWMRSGYKKKSTCDVCGFHAKYPTQIAVFHTDGDLSNIELTNLRSVCLNCIELIKYQKINWKRGDLQVDQPITKVIG